jgi:hypothetical protein
VLHPLGSGKNYCERPSGRSSHLITLSGELAEDRSNTWIYVSDMKMNIFIGIKTSGNFQHSSCKLSLIQRKRRLTIVLAGGKVTSAGIIVVKNGIVKSLSPLSGHYRSSIDVSTLLSFNILFQYHLPISSSSILLQYY